MIENYERAIGRIEGKLDLLIEAHGQMGQKWERLAREFAQMRSTQDAQAHELRALTRRIEEAEQPVHEFGRWRERVVGALMVLGLGSALIGGSAVAFWQKLSGILR